MTNSKKIVLEIKDILSFHKIILNNLSAQNNLGKFRNEVSAIFNSAGIAIYLPPPPKSILSLMNRLINYSNSNKEQFVPIKACLTHYAFEKIHPFLDGNGRVGRLILQKIMIQEGYGMKGLLSVEEYLDNHRSSYYDALEETERDVTNYLQFMLEAISETSIQAKNLVIQKQKADITDFLLPRRAEIYSIIKDHQLINFDMIRRRFMAVNERTLRYDLKKLQDKGLISKRGITKGVYYQIAEK